jgi:hypothetical protein
LQSIGLPVGNETVHYLLSADDHAIVVQNEGDAEYMTELIEEYQRWGLNVNSLKSEYLNIGRDIQNIKLEHNTEIKSSWPYTCRY